MANSRLQQLLEIAEEGWRMTTLRKQTSQQLYPFSKIQTQASTHYVYSSTHLKLAN